MTETLRQAGDTRKTLRTVAEFRPMTVAEAKQLRYNDHPHFERMDSTAAEIKVNGDPQTWKRKFPGVRVPLKYGLYEYGDDDCRRRQDSEPMNMLMVKISPWRTESLNKATGEWEAS